MVDLPDCVMNLLVLTADRELYSVVFKKISPLLKFIVNSSIVCGGIINTQYKQSGR